MKQTFFGLDNLLWHREIEGLRGLANRNWTNIKRPPDGKRWEGMVGYDDLDHAIFSDPIFGLRAQFRQIALWALRGARSIQAIIERQTDVAADQVEYAEAIAREMMIAGQENRPLEWWVPGGGGKIKPSHRIDAANFMRAMVRWELGLQPATENHLQSALDLYHRGLAKNPVKL